MLGWAQLFTRPTSIFIKWTPLLQRQGEWNRESWIFSADPGVSGSAANLAAVPWETVLLLPDNTARHVFSTYPVALSFLLTNYKLHQKAHFKLMLKVERVTVSQIQSGSWFYKRGAWKLKALLLKQYGDDTVRSLR